MQAVSYWQAKLEMLCLIVCNFPFSHRPQLILRNILFA